MPASDFIIGSNGCSIMKSKLSLFLAAACLLTAPSFSPAAPIIDIDNDANYSWTWPSDLTLGYQFQVGDPLTFNALAVFDVVSAIRGSASTPHANTPGLNASHQVGVWDSQGNLLVSAIVDPSDPTAASANTYGQWVYQEIAPTTLTAGLYTIGAFYAANSDPVMVQQTAIDLNGAAYVQGRYVYSSTFQRPTGAYSPNEEQYFGPTLMSVPDGGLTISLLGFAMFGLDALRRRIRA